MKLISSSLLAELAGGASASPRGRTHYNLHAAPTDVVQRYLVVANRNSYFRAHRHATRAELAVIVRGALDLLVFDDAGCITARHAFGAGAANLAYENGPGIWHTVVVREDATTFLEVKQGPYDPHTASEFAPWSPPEGEPAAARFLEWARTAAPGDRVPA